MVGGRNDRYIFTSVELFPLSHTCSIPDLPQVRDSHSLSLLSGGRLVVCGGKNHSWDAFDSCISWVEGNTNWTSLFNMRCPPKFFFFKTQYQCGEIWSHSMDSALSSRSDCAAGRQHHRYGSQLKCRDMARYKSKHRFFLLICQVVPYSH